MKRDIRKEIKVGIVTISALVLLVVGLILGNGFSLFGDKSIIYFQFEDSKGIQRGEPVTMNGVKIGSVKDIVLKKEIVVIKTEIEDISLISIDAAAEIAMLEITGGKKINVISNPKSEMIKNYGIIKGKTTSDLGDIAADFADMKNDIKQLIQKIDVTVTSVNSIVADEKIKSDIVTIISETAVIISKLENVINNGKFDKSIDNLYFVSTELNNLMKQNTNKISNIIDNADQSMTNINVVSKDIAQYNEQIKKTIDEINILMQKINKSDNVVGKLLNDKEFAKDLDSALINMNILLEQIKKHGVNANIRLGARP